MTAADVMLSDGFRPLRVVRDYDGLHGCLRDRVAELEVTYDDLDELCLLPDRYCSKLFGPKKVRTFGKTSLGLILAALGLCLVVAVDPNTQCEMRRRSRRRLRREHIR
jgi:hypothetical protein